MNIDHSTGAGTSLFRLLAPLALGLALVGTSVAALRRPPRLPGTGLDSVVSAVGLGLGLVVCTLWILALCAHALPLPFGHHRRHGDERRGPEATTEQVTAPSAAGGRWTRWVTSLPLALGVHLLATTPAVAADVATTDTPHRGGGGHVVAPENPDAAAFPTVEGSQQDATPAPGWSFTRQAQPLPPSWGGARRSGDVVVQPGDSLWGIAARELGPGASDADVAERWHLWYQDNRHVIGPDPDLLLPGQELRAPL